MALGQFFQLKLLFLLMKKGWVNVLDEGKVVGSVMVDFRNLETSSTLLSTTYYWRKSRAIKSVTNSVN